MADYDYIEVPTKPVECVEDMIAWAKKMEEKEGLSYNEILDKPLMTGHDLMALPHEPDDYLIENFLWKNDVAFIIGKEKACKSIFTTQESMAMTCCEPFLETFDIDKSLKVLYIQAEGDIGETKNRMVNALTHPNINWNPDNWWHFYPPSLALDTDEGCADLEARINAMKLVPDVIVLDPVYMSMNGDLNDNAAVRRFLRNIRVLKQTFGCSFILVHHEHKPKTDIKGNKIHEGDNSIFGSGMFKNFASHVLRISIANERGNEISEDKEDCGTYRKVVCSTQRSGKVNKKVLLKLNEATGMFDILGAKSTSPIQQSALQALKIHQPISVVDLQKNTGINKNTLKNAMQELKKKKLVVNKKGKWCITVKK